MGDSMYDGDLYVGGEFDGLGVDGVPDEMTETELQWLERKLAMPVHGIDTPAAGGLIPTAIVVQNPH